MTYRKKYYRKKTYSNNLPLSIFLLGVLILISLHTWIKSIPSEIIPIIIIIGILLGCGGIYLLWYLHKKEQERIRALQIADIDNMTGVEFENYLARVLESQGYKVLLTKITGDYGGDIVAHKDGVVTIIQAKRYKGLVGLETVQQAVAAKPYYKATQAIVITNSYFTYQAKELAKVNLCDLIDRNTLTTWIVEFQKGNR